MTGLHVIRAGWVLPVTAPPLRDGAVAVREGVLLDVGPAAELLARHPGAPVQELPASVLLPGLTNAHTHLSLTALAGRLPRDAGFLSWLGSAARAAAALSPEEVAASTDLGLLESWRLGTVLVGEVTTRAEGWDRILAHGRMQGRVYFEFLGVTEDRARERFAAAARAAARLAAHPGADAVLPGLSPHAPYSVWPDLWARTGELARRHGFRWTTHLAESPDEQRFLLEGTGPLREYLEGLGVWDGSFPVPGRGAVALLEAAGALDERALLVHGVHLEPEEMDRLAAAGAALCLCPRSNAYLGLPPPPVQALHERGVRLCLGTDSKASNRDLSVWGEMRAVRRLAPSIPAARILEMATVRGAMALGMSHLSGSLRPGVMANVVAVEFGGGLPSGSPEDPLVEEPVEDRVRVLE